MQEKMCYDILVNEIADKNSVVNKTVILRRE